MSRLIDLTGQKFGRLTVIKRAPNKILPGGQQKTQWECKCDCGNITIVLGYLLKNGETKSCGCLNSELTSKRNKENKKYNQYDLTGTYGIGYTRKGEPFYFDLEDYDKIKNYCWRINKNGYVTSKYDDNGKQKGIKLHRLIMGCTDKNVLVDHIHGEKSRHDNRKSNLRLCNDLLNSFNRKRRTDNTSGVTGVYWDKEQNKWDARIAYKHKTIRLGRFKKFDDAVKARKAAEEKYFGEWSYDNSQNVEVA